MSPRCCCCCRRRRATWYCNSPLSFRSYSRLEIDTLFFIFYFQPSTRQQQLAAKALRASGWLFHMQVMCAGSESLCEAGHDAPVLHPPQHLTWMRRQSNEMTEVTPSPAQPQPLLVPRAPASTCAVPQVTDDHERGSFIFFDYENGCVVCDAGAVVVVGVHVCDLAVWLHGLQRRVACVILLLSLGGRQSCWRTLCCDTVIFAGNKIKRRWCCAARP